MGFPASGTIFNLVVFHREYFPAGAFNIYLGHKSVLPDDIEKVYQRKYRL
jgi:hypothetical protein